MREPSILTQQAKLDAILPHRHVCKPCQQLRFQFDVTNLIWSHSNIRIKMQTWQFATHFRNSAVYDALSPLYKKPPFPSLSLAAVVWPLRCDASTSSNAIAAARTFSSSSTLIRATLFPGDGVCPEIAEPVKLVALSLSHISSQLYCSLTLLV